MSLVGLSLRFPIEDVEQELDTAELQRLEDQKFQEEHKACLLECIEVGEQGEVDGAREIKTLVSNLAEAHVGTEGGRLGNKAFWLLADAGFGNRAVQGKYHFEDNLLLGDLLIECSISEADLICQLIADGGGSVEHKEALQHNLQKFIQR